MMECISLTSLFMMNTNLINKNYKIINIYKMKYDLMLISFHFKIQC